MRKSNGDRVGSKEDGKSAETIKDGRIRSLCAATPGNIQGRCVNGVSVPRAGCLKRSWQPENVRLLPLTAGSSGPGKRGDAHLKESVLSSCVKGGKVACSPPLKGRTDGTRLGRQPDCRNDSKMGDAVRDRNRKKEKSRSE